MKSPNRSSVSPWWLLVVLLTGVQLGMLIAPLSSQSRSDDVWVLLPLLPLTGAEVEQELVQTGLLLPPETQGGDLERLGSRLADRLGHSAWLGPTMSVDDFTVGLSHLGSDGVPALSEVQSAELQPVLERLRSVRLELDRSERGMRDLAIELACSRDRLLEVLGPDVQYELQRRLAGKPGGKP